MKRITISLSVLFISLITVLCNNSNVKRNVPNTSDATLDRVTGTQHKPVADNASSIILDTFSIHSIPDSLFGSSCIYSATEELFKKNNFILFNQLGSPDYAVISVNHKLIFLRMDTSNHSTIAYINSTYTITVQTEQGKETGEESIRSTGEMTVKNRRGDSTSVHLFGECGS